MKVSVDWLKDYIAAGEDADASAHVLTMAGIEVEGVDYSSFSIDKVIAVKIMDAEAHPNADKLRICTVDAGTETLKIVCGDPSVNVGDLVPLALPGAILAGGLKIKKSKIRGVESPGMLCAEKELGLTEEGSGVMLLPDDTTPGIALEEALSDLSPSLMVSASGGAKKAQGRNGGYSDAIFEVGLTPNRSDCLSIYGIARELGALTGKVPVFPEISLREGARPVGEDISVEIKEAKLCHRYAARVIKGITVKPSPLWLRRRLEASGIRAINSIVDITNYVMLELGQPLHAFDLEKVNGGKIIVRKAKAGETLQTLDGVQRSFSGEELLICDEEAPLALAGVMGGELSAVSEATVDILLESAYFAPVTVRKTSKRFGLHTESSHRFERGIDIQGVARAIDRAAMLISELAGGELSSGLIDSYPVTYSDKVISFRPSRCSEMLGIEISDDDVLAYLKKLGMQISGSGSDISVIPPSYRVDIEREIDLVEEVARLKGYDSIPAVPLSGGMSEHLQERANISVHGLQSHMAALGYNEVINYVFQSPDEKGKLDPSGSHAGKQIEILNPISEEMSVMRQSLVPGLLQTISMNCNRQNRDLRLFEVGKVFSALRGSYEENLRLTAIATGEKVPVLWRKESSVLDLKGCLENLLDLLGFNGYTFENRRDIPYLHPGIAAAVFLGGEKVGTIGELHPLVQENFDIENKVYVFDLDLDKIGRLDKGKYSFKDIPSYPSVERDVALLVDKHVSLAELTTYINGLKLVLLEGVDVFDLFEGKGIDPGKKSIGLRLRYRSHDRTLADEGVRKVHDSILSSLVEKAGAVIR